MSPQSAKPTVPDSAPGRQRPAVASLFAFGVGALATLGLFGVLRSWEHKRVQADLEMMARGRLAAIQADVSACLETLYALREVYASSKSVERHEFRAAVEECRPRRPEIRSLRWVARVRPEERADFEKPRATTTARDSPFVN
jgi:CHASE1-domain containing sensor protein